jgi:hypothetical protein
MRIVRHLAATAGMGLACLLFLSSTGFADSYDAYTGNIHAGAFQIRDVSHVDARTNLDGRGRQTLGYRGNPAMTLGLDFRVLADLIYITELGVWDDNVMDLRTLETQQVLLSPHYLSVWDLNTLELLAWVETQPGTGDLRGDYRYFELAEPLELPRGTEFSVAVYYGVDNEDSNGNSGRVDQDFEATPTFDDGGGALAGIGGGRYGHGPDLPSIPDTGPSHRYHSGSFRYRVVQAVPEPGLWLMLLAGTSGVGWACRRRKSAAWRRRAP